MQLTLGLAGWMTEEGFAAKDGPGRLGLAINQNEKTCVTYSVPSMPEIRNFLIYPAAPKPVLTLISLSLFGNISIRACLDCRNIKGKVQEEKTEERN